MIALNCVSFDFKPPIRRRPYYGPRRPIPPILPTLPPPTPEPPIIGMPSPIIEKSADFVNERVYCMKAVHSGKTIGIVNEGDNQVFQYGENCSPKSSYQVIRIVDSNEYYLLNEHSGFVLTEYVESGPVHPIKLSNWENKETQRWTFIDFGMNELQIVNSATNYIVDVEFGGTGNGLRLIAYQSNHKGPNQRFTFTLMNSIVPEIQPNEIIGYRIADPEDFFDEGIYCFKNIKSSKVIGVMDGSPAVVQFGNTCSPDFTYRVIRIVGTDQFKIESMSGRGVLTVTDIEASKEPVHLTLWENLDTQKWRFSYRNDTHREDREIQLRNVETNNTLDIWYGDLRDGAEVIAWVNNHDDPNERWNIELVDKM